MDRARLKEIKRKTLEGAGIIPWNRKPKDFPTELYIFFRDMLLDILDALLEEEKPVATETGMDKRTRMKKLILEMLEIV